MIRTNLLAAFLALLTIFSAEAAALSSEKDAWTHVKQNVRMSGLGVNVLLSKRELLASSL